MALTPLEFTLLLICGLLVIALAFVYHFCYSGRPQRVEYAVAKANDDGTVVVYIVLDNDEAVDLAFFDTDDLFYNRAQARSLVNSINNIATYYNEDWIN